MEKALKWGKRWQKGMQVVETLQKIVMENSWLLEHIQTVPTAVKQNEEPHCCFNGAHVF